MKHNWSRQQIINVLEDVLATQAKRTALATNEDDIDRDRNYMAGILLALSMIDDRYGFEVSIFSEVDEMIDRAKFARLYKKVQHDH